MTVLISPPVADSAAHLAVAAGRVPRATYRLQLHRGFPFADAAAVVPYLADLGVSDAYTSPILRARAGSTHGYDVVDHGMINPELGGDAGFEQFATALKTANLGLILDTVPNHMGVFDPANGWWMDVLENGVSSTVAGHFDIDWQPVKPELAGKVLLPILSDQYGDVLERGKFRLVYEEGAFYIFAGQVKLPVAPGTYDRILGRKRDDLVKELGETDEHVQELLSILTQIHNLPSRTETDHVKLAERNREKEIVKRRIASLHAACPEFRAALDATIAGYNGTPGEPASFDLMDQLLDAQTYRPAYWRVAGEEINYRRFFDINDLAAIRVELPQVFEAVHDLAFRLLAEGKATGLRIDHPDGLLDPVRYFHQLQEAFAARQAAAVGARERESAGARNAEGNGAHALVRSGGPARLADWFTAASVERENALPPWPLYVVAEKILAAGEPLPPDWAVAGTVGYDFLNDLNGLYVARRSRRAFDRIYGQFTGRELDYKPLVTATKRVVMQVSMASEINSLAHQLERLANKNRRYRDLTLNSLVRAIREVIACLPVYRTYLTSPGSVLPRDAAYVEQAVEEAKRHNVRVAEQIFDFLRDTLLWRNYELFQPEDRPGVVAFVRRFQQIAGPVTAKGVEDTAFYVYNRLVSLNEVGGDPESFGLTLAGFHRRNAARLQRWPHAMLATSTHDTKRSEDVRARINVLSEIPEEWRGALLRWNRSNTSCKSIVDGELAPGRNDEYLFYQVLLGAWPFGDSGGRGSRLADESAGSAGAAPSRCDPSPEEFAVFRERMTDYMLKAIKEAEVHTSWVNPNEEYEEATRNFVTQVLTDDPADPFRQDFAALQRRVAFFGQVNGLSQALLKLTSPGVPDIYQGQEVWDFSLVDPDNRRPVDYDRRRDLLADVRRRIDDGDLTALCKELLASSTDGRIKLFVTHRVLSYRREHPQLFHAGGYRSLRAIGRRRRHVCAFVRQREQESLMVVAPRLVVQLAGSSEMWPLGRAAWRDTWLVLPREPVGRMFRNIFTGAAIAVQEGDGIAGLPVAEVCRDFPVALLERVGE
jgi:(1->4)-alpha-D-glucan 1-alpha-D-glucosylmutase